ncbi:C40 family peptidase [Brevibacillus dissolubilis]|uniref:C40 family peptidase n=1 Tax=Brevibacillus dissolubilis TaxID=1844116 RepID=UPI00159BC68A|nr:NlpC/P60 family protein [Brevibacillus dissolubilis]
MEQKALLLPLALAGALLTMEPTAVEAANKTKTKPVSHKKEDTAVSDDLGEPAFGEGLIIKSVPSPLEQLMRKQLIQTVDSLIGKPVVAGGATPKGFDSGGFVQYVYKQSGIDLPRLSKNQFAAGIPVERKDLQVGDLIFFSPSKNGIIGHVGIYVGHNQMVHAAWKQKKIMITDLTWYDRHDQVVGYRRMLGKKAGESWQGVPGKAVQPVRDIQPANAVQPAKVKVQPENAAQPVKTVVQPENAAQPAKAVVQPTNTVQPAKATVQPTNTVQPSKATVQPTNTVQPAKATVQQANPAVAPSNSKVASETGNELTNQAVNSDFNVTQQPDKPLTTTEDQTSGLTQTSVKARTPAPAPTPVKAQTSAPAPTPVKAQTRAPVPAPPKPQPQTKAPTPIKVKTPAPSAPLQHPATKIPTPAPQPTFQQKLTKQVQTVLGKPYVYGGNTPRGFDCSGFVQYVYKQLGINLPRVTHAQSKIGKPVKRSELQPGDLLFFSTNKNGVVSHVGIYMGNNKMAHAAWKQKKMMITDLTWYYKNYQLIAIRRVQHLGSAA